LLNIERLGIEDERKALEIVQVFQFKVQKDSLNKEFLSDKKNILIGAYRENQLVGFLYGYSLPRIERENPLMFLYSIAVIPEYRSKGIAKKMVKYFKEICNKNNCMKMFLITNESNIAAMALYKATKGKRKCTDDVIFTYVDEDLTS